MRSSTSMIVARSSHAGIRKEIRTKARTLSQHLPRDRAARVLLVPLAGLVVARTGLSLAVLAHEGSPLLPGFPRYEYEARPGDAYGYYSAMRELMATLPRLGPVLTLVVALGLAGVVAIAVLVARGRLRADALFFGGVACAALVLFALVLR